MKKYEGSKADNKSDKKAAKKKGVSFKKFESGKLDKKMDKGKK